MAERRWGLCERVELMCGCSISTWGGPMKCVYGEVVAASIGWCRAPGVLSYHQERFVALRGPPPIRPLYNGRIVCVPTPHRTHIHRLYSCHACVQLIGVQLLFFCWFDVLVCAFGVHFGGCYTSMKAYGWVFFLCILICAWLHRTVYIIIILRIFIASIINISLLLYVSGLYALYFALAFTVKRICNLYFSNYKNPNNRTEKHFSTFWFLAELNAEALLQTESTISCLECF